MKEIVLSVVLLSSMISTAGIGEKRLANGDSFTTDSPITVKNAFCFNSRYRFGETSHINLWYLYTLNYAYTYYTDNPFGYGTYTNMPRKLNVDVRFHQRGMWDYYATLKCSVERTESMDANSYHGTGTVDTISTTAGWDEITNLSYSITVEADKNNKVFSYRGYFTNACTGAGVPFWGNKSEASCVVDRPMLGFVWDSHIPNITFGVANSDIDLRFTPDTNTIYRTILCRNILNEVMVITNSLCSFDIGSSAYTNVTIDPVIIPSQSTILGSSSGDQIHYGIFYE